MLNTLLVQQQTHNVRKKNIFKKIELSNYLSVMVIVWKSERNILIDSATAQKKTVFELLWNRSTWQHKKVLFPRFRMTRQHFSSIFKRLSPPSITHNPHSKAPFNFLGFMSVKNRI